MRSLRVSMIGVYRIDTAGVESAEIKTAQLRVASMVCVKARGVPWSSMGTCWTTTELIRLDGSSSR
jgi:hypothetical protein